MSCVFSVIIPTYNRAATLPRAVASVLAQTCGDFELIVVDDGSTDDTPALVAAITDGRVRCIRQENRGVSAARNAGARAANGRYLAFLDSDDAALPHWLERLAAALDAPQTGIAYCGVTLQPENGADPIVLLPSNPESNPDRGQAGGSDLFLSLAFALRRPVFDAVGGYNEALHYSENTELHWRLQDYCREAGWRCAYVDEPLGIYYSTRLGGARQPRNFARRLSSYEALLAAHAPRFERDPRLYAVYWSLAGAAAARLGEMRKARRYFREAVRWDGRNPRHRLRLLLSYVPLVAERFWLRHYS